jgi:hypothetical protein
MTEKKQCWKKGCVEDAHEITMKPVGKVMSGYMTTCNRHEAEIRRILEGVVKAVDTELAIEGIKLKPAPIAGYA